MNKGRITAERAREMARKARSASPWSRGPACGTFNARESYRRYVAAGPRGAKEPGNTPNG